MPTTFWVEGEGCLFFNKLQLYMKYRCPDFDIAGENNLTMNVHVVKETHKRNTLHSTPPNPNRVNSNLQSTIFRFRLFIKIVELS